VKGEIEQKSSRAVEQQSSRTEVGAIQEMQIFSTNAYRIPHTHMPYAHTNPYPISIILTGTENAIRRKFALISFLKVRFKMNVGILLIILIFA